MMPWTTTQARFELEQMRARYLEEFGPEGYGADDFPSFVQAQLDMLDARCMDSSKEVITEVRVEVPRSTPFIVQLVRCRASRCRAKSFSCVLGTWTFHTQWRRE